MAGDHFKIIRAGPRRLMIFTLFRNVVQVKPDELRRHLREMLRMIEEAELMLDLRVAGIMPVADGRVFAERGQEIVEIGIQRQLLQAFTIFDAQGDLLLTQRFEELFIALASPCEPGRHTAPDPLHRAVALLLEIPVLAQLVCPQLGCVDPLFQPSLRRAKKEVNTPRVHDNAGCPDLHREIQGLQGIAIPEGQFTGVLRGGLI